MLPSRGRGSHLAIVGLLHREAHAAEAEVEELRGAASLEVSHRAVEAGGHLDQLPRAALEERVGTQRGRDGRRSCEEGEDGRADLAVFGTEVGQQAGAAAHLVEAMEGDGRSWRAGGRPMEGHGRFDAARTWWKPRRPASDLKRDVAMGGGERRGGRAA